MSCLRIEQIYAYLDKDLPARQQADIEAHLTGCRTCREAVEERQRLLEAARDIPPLPVPKDFPSQVMSRIQLELVSTRDVLIAASLGFSAMLATMLTVFFWSGQNLFDFLIGLNHSALHSFQAFLVTCAKLFKTLLLIFRVLRQSIGSMLETLARAAAMLSPETQAAMISATLICFAGLFLLIRKKALMGDS
jgi:predicted anti-sigma-YlaC factor YlaD